MAPWVMVRSIQFLRRGNSQALYYVVKLYSNTGHKKKFSEISNKYRPWTEIIIFLWKKYMRRVISKTSVRAIIFQNHPPTSIFNFTSKFLQGQCIGPVRIRPPQFRIPHHDTGARMWTQSSTYHQKCCICDIDGGFFMVVRRYDIMPRWHRNGPNALRDHAI